MTRVDVRREAAPDIRRRFAPKNLARARVAEIGSVGVLRILVDGEHFEPGPVRIEIGNMNRVTVTEAGRIKSLAVRSDGARAVDDVVFSVTIHVGDAQAVISLS